MLNNTVFRLKELKKLKILFFGGSITAGAGSSDQSRTCFRALVTDHFKKLCPDAEIEDVNSCMGGTGTGLGMLRCDQDVIAHKPDLVFVEFTANDWGDSYDNVLPNVETLFRKIRRALPETDIVTLFTTYTDIAADAEAGVEYESRSAHITAAHRYNIPTIDVGNAFHAHILRHGGKFEDFIPDTLHPNDAGHKVLAQVINARLDRWLDSADAKEIIPHAMPEPIGEVFEEATVLPASEIGDLKTDGFDLNGETLECVCGSGSLSFSFDGCGIGIYWGDTYLYGDIELRIDDEEPVTVKSWDHLVRSFAKLRAAIVTRDLPRGHHTVKITSLPLQEPSPDHKVRINGFFIF